MTATPRVGARSWRWRSGGTLVALLSLAGPARAEMRVATDFDGGAAKEVVIDRAKQTVRLAPGGDPKRGWPCWWCVRIDGLRAGEALTVEVTTPAAGLPAFKLGGDKALGAEWLFPAQASYSDDGETWLRTGTGRRSGTVTAYSLKPKGGTVTVAWGPPFTPKDTAALVKLAEAATPDARGFELCKSNGGRPVVALRFRGGDAADERRFGLWVSARQHAWEVGGSWVARGLVRWLASDQPRAVWLRRNAEVIVVPIMDVDNVVAGNGGKEGEPQDHNRDWSERPRYAEVAAAQKRLSAFAAAGRMDLFVDLHNPGPTTRRPFFFVSGDDQLTETGRRNLGKWLAAARAEIADPVPLDVTTRTAGPDYHPLWRQVSGNWVQANANRHTVAVCLETPWNTPQSTPDGYEAVGRQLGLAVERHLRGRTREQE